MNKLKVSLSLLTVLPLTLCAADSRGSGDAVFPAVSEIPETLLTRPGVKVSTAADGTILLDGKPHFLLGCRMTDRSPGRDLQPRPGYPDSLKFLYEEPLTLETAQRLGFDFLSTANAPTFLPRFIKNYRTGWDGYESIYRIGLPMHVDAGGFAPWEAGLLSTQKYRHLLPPEATDMGGHPGNRMAYSMVAPAGRAIYLAQWRSGIEEAEKYHVPLMRLELFNEPHYNDCSEAARKGFAAFLKRKYGTATAMNQAWGSSYPSFEAAAAFRKESENAGLFVDYSLFLESCVVSLCHEGDTLLKKHFPNACTTVQISGGEAFREIPLRRMNLYALNQVLSGVSTNTGGGTELSSAVKLAPHTIDTPSLSAVGGGMLQTALFRTLAKGKTLIDDESYFGIHDTAGIYLDFIRGISCYSAFEWSKRAWSWHTPAEGLAAAERWPWMILNPYALPAENFTRLLKAKAVIRRLDDFFAVRTRNTLRPVAVLFSTATERFNGFSGSLESYYSNTVMGALTFRGYQCDVLPEEELPKGALQDKKVLLAAGIDQLPAASFSAIRRFAENGGTVISLLGTMSGDEYNRPHRAPLFDLKLKPSLDNPPAYRGPRDASIPGPLRGIGAWQVTKADRWQNLGGGVFTRPYGKGRLVFIGMRYEDYSLAAILGGLLQQNQILPEATILRADNRELMPGLEISASRQQGIYALAILNLDDCPKLAKVQSCESGPVLEAVTLSSRQRSADGSILLEIPRHGFRVLCFGPVPLLEKRFGKTALQTEIQVRAAAAKLPHSSAAKSEKQGYPADPVRLRTLDLRPFVNRGFIDDAPGNGKGGWTDSGAADSLIGVPFGMQRFLNIPCDIIRWDMNNGNTCIVMDSPRLLPGFGVREVNNIPVKGKVAAFYFFQCSVWCAPGEHQFSYIVKYRSGREHVIPVIGGKNNGDWYAPGRGGNPLQKYAAWVNTSNRGFYCIREENPYPQDEVLSISLKTALPREAEVVPNSLGSAIPVVIAISVEEPSPEELPPAGFIPCRASGATLGFNGITAKASADGSTVTAKLTPKTIRYCGARIFLDAKSAVELDRLSKTPGSQLTFLIRRDSDLFGKPNRDRSDFQIKFGGGNYFRTPGQMTLEKNTFSRITVPLEKLIPQKDKMRPELFIQFSRLSAGFTIRNIGLIPGK